MPTEHPTPTPTETPTGPPREHPTGPPTETSSPAERDGSPRREPADGNAPDPIDARLWALTFRSAEVVASIVGLLADVPEGLDRHEVEAHVHRTEGGSLSTIRNTIAELARSGVIYVSTEALKITPLGRAWALGAIDPRISPLPRLEHRDRGDGTLRLVWRRPTLATLDAGRQSSPNNPTEEVNP